jgi:hypothetical protein
MKKTAIKIVMLLGLIIPNIYSQTNWVIEATKDNAKEEEIKLGNQKTGGKYLLKNTTVEFEFEKTKEVLSAILKHGKRRWGINLVWGTMTEKFNNSNYININRKPGATGPLKTGELVAIRVENGGYLSKKTSNAGVNLDFVSSNVIETSIPYEFAFFDQSGIEGLVVKTNIEYGLKNIIENDYLIYCGRDYGINLDWYQNCLDGSLSMFDEFQNKISIAEKGAKVGKRLYKMVKD